MVTFNINMLKLSYCPGAFKTRLTLRYADWSSEKNDWRKEGNKELSERIRKLCQCPLLLDANGVSSISVSV